MSANKRGATPIESAIVITIIALLVAAMFIGAWQKAKKVRADERAKALVEAPADHAHKWGKWDAPVLAVDMMSGMRFTQSRTCEICGLAEVRRVQVAPSP